MKQNTLKHKILAMIIVSLLALSFNLSMNVSSSSIKDTTDCIWYDEFDDSGSIYSSLSSNYEVSGGYVKLPSDTNNKKEYDFNDEDDDGSILHEAHSTEKDLSKQFYGSGPTFPGKRTVADDSFGYDIDDIQEDDDIVKETESSYFGKIFKRTYFPIHQFKFNINIPSDELKGFVFNWDYGPYNDEANIEKIILYVWDYSPLLVDRWMKEEEIEYKDDGTGNVERIKFSFDSETNDGDYVSDDRYLDFLIVAIPKNHGEGPCILATDYVNLSATSETGYCLEDGVVVSEFINPTNLEGWESLVWKGSRSNDLLSLKIQVLDEDGELVDDDDLSGNSKGFDYEDSPLDITSMPVSVGKIRLKATFKTSTISLTPRLYMWGVTWQKQDKKYSDSFSSSMRLETLEGASFDGEIEINDYFGDWPIFGRDTENTRSFSGFGPAKEDHDELYWKTKKDTIGGGLISPVMGDDGRIYLYSSSSNKIYAFNATVDVDRIGKEQNIVDESKSGFIVDSAVAVSEDYVLVANGEIGASNKVYALDRFDLSSEIWNYTYPDEEIICFSSAPTVANGKVFVTSWNGIFDSVVVQNAIDIYDAIVSLFGLTTQGNNRVIAIDVADGKEIWAKRLPGGSFSTPAISEGVVYAACNNIYGEDLFAFDEDTGEQLWKAEVGLMGTASPVVYKDNVYVVAKEHKNLGLTGDVKLFALDKTSGEVLWNQTITADVGLLDIIGESYSAGLLLFYPMSTCTPAVYENRIYVTSPDLKLLSFNTNNGDKMFEVDLSVSGVSKQNCISPVVADDVVYAVTPIYSKTNIVNRYGVISAFSTSDDTEEALWESKCNIGDAAKDALNWVLSSPIVSDGVVYISPTTELESLNGRVVAIGNYSRNYKAKVVSNPIYLPEAQLWDEFSADFDENDENTITFSILDENADVIDTDFNGTKYDISHISNGVIKLQAMFNVGNHSLDLPVLNSWHVTWFTNNNLPQFKTNTFKPDPSGWINTNTPVCSIDVYDDLPGLDVSTARYKITYVDEDDDDVESDWIEADCTGEDDSTATETITADISEADIADEIKTLKSITISIEDVAGYEATITKTFKKDTKEPSSSIKSISSFNSIYTDEVIIKASASDADSGVKHATLMYQYSYDGEPDSLTDWADYGDPVESPFSWTFGQLGSVVMDSGYYIFVTVAEDNSGNVEDIDDKDADETLVFFFDMKTPSKPSFAKDEYISKEAPEISVSFEDDYELLSVEYLILGLHGLNEWQTINDEVSSATLTETIDLSEYWDEMIDGNTYYLYFRLVDAAGNVYETPDEDDGIKITKDTQAGTSYVDTSDFSDQMDNEFIVSASLVNDENIDTVKLYYRYSKDNKTWSDWKQYGENINGSPFEWKFIAEEGDGYYEFKTVVEDVVGNIQESEIQHAQVSLFPLVTVSAVFLAIAAIVIGAIVVILRRRKTANI